MATLWPYRSGRAYAQRRRAARSQAGANGQAAQRAHDDVELSRRAVGCRVLRPDCKPAEDSRAEVRETGVRAEAGTHCCAAYPDLALLAATM